MLTKYRIKARCSDAKIDEVEALHHSKKNQHDVGEPCPVERNLHKKAEMVRAYMKSREYKARYTPET